MKNQNNLRNFCIISHIDHGKSTLADRFLELTKTIDKNKMREQFLDMMDLERERGITIKMQPVRMTYTLNDKRYILNLIDTPGHIDFSYEVSRSLTAVEGAILLVDGSKGIQAQTLYNLELAKKQNLVIIPVVNKIDLPQTRIDENKEELARLVDVSKDKILAISAKKGTNIENLLLEIIKRIPPPSTNFEKPLRALIFDSKYNPYKGVITYVRVVEGRIKSGQKIYLMAEEIQAEAKEIGFLKPEFFRQRELKAGEIGYIATGIKEPEKVRIGDTITILDSFVESLSGYKEPKPVVFASIYPENSDDYDLLKEALGELKLNDPSLNFEPEDRAVLGRGFRCGFLGSLHIEIVIERLRREFGLSLIISTPSVIYKIIDKKDKEVLIPSAVDWPASPDERTSRGGPDPLKIKETREPWVKLEIITPLNYLGPVLEISKNLQGKYLETRYLSREKALLVFEAPLREMIQGFYDRLKSVSQGFASMNYEILDFRPADLVKLEVLIAGKKEEAFSKIVPEEKTYLEGRKIVKKLKDVLPPQLFPVALQAAVGGKIIARETLSAKRKDVTAALYGGDYTRKKKLLDKQKKGKKKLKEKGEARIPPEVFLEIFKKI